MKQKQKRKHLEPIFLSTPAKMSTGLLYSQKSDPQLSPSLEDSALVLKAKDYSPESEYFSCNSSLPASCSAELQKPRSSAPQAESCAVAPVRDQKEGENSSASRYFSCVSSPSKFNLADNDGKEGTHQLHQDVPHGCSELVKPQDLEQRDNFSSDPQISFLQLANYNKKNKWLTPSEQGKEERKMKIYYMNVKMKRGVAVLWDKDEEMGPSKKRVKIEEMTFTEKIYPSSAYSCVSALKDPAASKSKMGSEFQEERKEAHVPAEPSTQEEFPRVKTPEWLVALDSGFRCMGCCRVFPSLEILQEHVVNGISEGFSCHTFHLAFSCLRNKNKKCKRKKRKTSVKKTITRCRIVKYSGMQSLSYK